MVRCRCHAMSCAWYVRYAAPTRARSLPRSSQIIDTIFWKGQTLGHAPQFTSRCFLLIVFSHFLSILFSVRASVSDETTGEVYIMQSFPSTSYTACESARDCVCMPETRAHTALKRIAKVKWNTNTQHRTRTPMPQTWMWTITSGVMRLLWREGERVKSPIAHLPHPLPRQFHCRHFPRECETNRLINIFMCVRVQVLECCLHYTFCCCCNLSQEGEFSHPEIRRTSPHMLFTQWHVTKVLQNNYLSWILGTNEKNTKTNGAKRCGNTRCAIYITHAPNAINFAFFPDFWIYILSCYIVSLCYTRRCYIKCMASALSSMDGKWN